VPLLFVSIDELERSGVSTVEVSPMWAAVRSSSIMVSCREGIAATLIYVCVTYFRSGYFFRRTMK